MKGRKATVFVSSTVKEKTKDWIYHPKHGNICPKCQKLISQEKRRKRVD